MKNRLFFNLLLVGAVTLICTLFFFPCLSRGMGAACSYIYCIPILLAAYRYGITGGIVGALTAGGIYSILTYKTGWNADRALPVAGLFIVGLITGLLSARASRTARTLKKKIAHITTVNEVGQGVVSTLDMKDLLNLVVSEITTTMQCEIVSIMLEDPETKTLKIEAAQGLDDETIGTVALKKGERISGWVAEHGEPVLVEDVEKDPRFARRSSEKYYTKSLISVPIKVKDRVTGVINANNKRSGQPFLEDDLELLTELVSHISMAIENARLFDRLQTAHINTIKALAVAIDARDHYTKEHSEFVAGYAVAIAREMRFDKKEVEEIKLASQLHDIGKINIRDNILGKTGSLTEEEWKEIKLHTEKGAEILKPLAFLGKVIELVREHHEHYDGTGYPDGKAGDEIPVGARIIAVTDAYDAMVSDRPYRKTKTHEQAMEELKKHSGTQFDPDVVEAFLRVLKRQEGPAYL